MKKVLILGTLVGVMIFGTGCVSTQDLEATSDNLRAISAEAKAKGDKLKAERLADEKEANEKKAKQEAEDKKKVEKTEDEKYDEWIGEQFNPYNNSHYKLIETVKYNMGNPSSFEHIQTVYEDKGNHEGIIVFMEFRGQNTFGGYVKNTVKANVDYSSNALQIIEYNGRKVN